MRRKFTITKLTSSRAISLSQYTLYIICAPIFQLAHSAQFNLSSSILTIPSEQYSNITVVVIPSSYHPPYRQDHTVKELLNTEAKYLLGTSSFEPCYPINSGVSRVPSGGAAGRKLLENRLRSTSFHTFLFLFIHPLRNTLFFNTNDFEFLSILEPKIPLIPPSGLSKCKPDKYHIVFESLNESKTQTR